MTNKSLILLGSTGSVGLQAADVARAQKYDVRAICANTDEKTTEEQIREFHPVCAAMADEKAAAGLRIRVADTGVKIYSGIDGICRMIQDTPADVAVNSIIGRAGLMPTLVVIESGKQLALANKESLVIAGDIVMRRARDADVRITPVDSEHCAIEQCLRCGSRNEVKKLIITASGGPFFGRNRAGLNGITVHDALAHPTWHMGRKITVDSATLMNKGFEVIEASRLFGIPEDNIDVVIHRESVIHSMVEYRDNSVIAQMSVPDMRLCVQYAIEEPDRYPAVIPELDLLKIGCLTFSAPDEKTFTPLRLARQALRAGGAAAAVLNAVNEVAVEAFLNERITFITLMDTLEYVCDKMSYAADVSDLEGILDCDREARQLAADFIPEA